MKLALVSSQGVGVLNLAISGFSAMSRDPMPIRGNDGRTF